MAPVTPDDSGLDLAVSGDGWLIQMTGGEGASEVTSLREQLTSATGELVPADELQTQQLAEARRALVEAERRIVDLENRLDRRNRRVAQVLDDAIGLAADDRTPWLFTQMKSGTTFLLHIILNYAACPRPVTADALHAFHTINNPHAGSGLSERLAVQRDFLAGGMPFDVLLHSHTTLPLAGGPFVCLTRHPLDVCVSSFHFHFAERGSGKSLGDVLPTVLERWAACNSFQLDAMAQRPNDGMLVRYEDLIESPMTVARSVLAQFGVLADEDRLRTAVERSDVNRLRAVEQEFGRPVVAPPSFRGGSFVRSGQVGEWRSAFTESDLRAATSLLQSLKGADQTLGKLGYELPEPSS